MTPLAEAVARVRVEIEAAFPPGEDSYCAIPRGDLRTILAALPTPEERAAISAGADYLDGDQRETLINYLVRTGGATDGE